MTWKCNKKECPETYPHKHLCDCEEFYPIEINNQDMWVCECWIINEGDDYE